MIIITVIITISISITISAALVHACAEARVRIIPVSVRKTLLRPRNCRNSSPPLIR